MKRTSHRVILAAVVLLGLVMYGLVSYLIASGVTKAERAQQEDHPLAHDLAFQDIEFTPRDGDLRLSGWLIPGRSSAPTLIFVHGIGSVRTGDKAMELAALLVSRGFNALMFDLRGHGTSEGEKVSGGYYEKQDVLGAFDYLVGRGVDPDKIGIIGFSMGAGTSILAAAQDPAIRALVADTPYAKASDLIAQETAKKTIFPEWFVPMFVPGVSLAARWLYGIELEALNPEEAVGGLDYPILVIHGSVDDRIPVEHGVRVHLASHPESRLWLVSNAGHVDAFLEHPDEYAGRVADYFNARLGGQ